MSVEREQERIIGSIKKWVPEKGWGFGQHFLPGSYAPIIHFLHVSNFISPASRIAEIELGTKISFIPGPAPIKGERPVALAIEILGPLAQADGDGGAL